MEVGRRDAREGVGADGGQWGEGRGWKGTAGRGCPGYITWESCWEVLPPHAPPHTPADPYKPRLETFG